MRCKITIVGAGETSAEAAARLSELDEADLLVLDADVTAARRLAADLDEASAARGEAPRVAATGSWDDVAGSHAVLLAGGDPHEAGRRAAERCPGAVVVVALDPVEKACRAVLMASELPRARVLGVAGIVEGARLRVLVAAALGVSARDVTALVLGGRGAAAVPLVSALRVAGVAVTDKLPADGVAELLARVRDGAPPGSRAAGTAAAEVVGAVVRDHRRVLACAALCQGELGLENAVAGVPVVVGRGGVERILEVALDDDERAALLASAG